MGDFSFRSAMREAGFDPDVEKESASQPRDFRGRWTAGGSGGSYAARARASSLMMGVMEAARGAGLGLNTGHIPDLHLGGRVWNDLVSRGKVDSRTQACASENGHIVTNPQTAAVLAQPYPSSGKAFATLNANAKELVLKHVDAENAILHETFHLVGSVPWAEETGMSRGIEDGIVEILANQAATGRLDDDGKAAWTADRENTPYSAFTGVMRNVAAAMGQPPERMAAGLKKDATSEDRMTRIVALMARNNGPEYQDALKLAGGDRKGAHEIIASAIESTMENLNAAVEHGQWRKELPKAVRDHLRNPFTPNKLLEAATKRNKKGGA
jgi:hypothetical protein